MHAKLSLQLSADEQALMACVDTFEQSAVGTQSDLRRYLESVPDKLRSVALAELVRVDIERRWKRGVPRRIAEYLREYPELRESDALPEILQSEFEFRRRAGQRPDVSEYQALSPSFVPQIEVDTARSLEETQTLDTSPTAPAPHPLTTLPTRIGKYKIKRELGSGGFGVVYQAYDEQLDRDVAIKVSKTVGGQGGLAADQLHEARSISRLDHSGIVKVLNVDQTEEGLGYVVYDFVDGQTLESRIREGEYTHEQAARWIAGLAEALHYAHKQKIVHRDIKPANILLDKDGNPKIVDFGLARHDGAFFVNEAGRLLGTAAYMSPEQANRDAHWATPQSDLYSLGIVFYELLCQKRPFDGDKLKDLLEQIQRRDPESPRSIDETIPKALETICLKSISKRPEQRYSNGKDMADAILTALRPADSTLKKIVRYAAIGVAIASIAVLAGILPRPEPTPPPPLSAPRINIMEIRVHDPERVNVLLQPRVLPLKPSDRLLIAVRLAPEAHGYMYLLHFEQNGKAKLLLPLPEDLAAQAPVQELNYPPIGSGLSRLDLDDGDGASLIAAIVSQTPLAKEQLDDLLQTRLALSVPPGIVARQRNVVISAVPPPMDRMPDAVLRGEDLAADVEMELTKDFKQKLASIGDGFYGVIVPHRADESQ